jgi:hypothetical protein
MTKIFGEDIEEFYSKRRSGFWQGFASIFDFSGSADAQSRTIKAYLAQDPKEIDAQARQSDLEAITGDALAVQGIQITPKKQGQGKKTPKH